MHGLPGLAAHMGHANALASWLVRYAIFPHAGSIVGQVVAHASWLQLQSSSTQYMTANRSKTPALNATTSKNGTGMRPNLPLR
jgi:hypothetical protein